MREDRDIYKEVLQSSRVHIVPEIKIMADTPQGRVILNILENILTAVLDGHSRLEKLDISENVHLSSLDPILLSQALVRLTEFRLRRSLSTAQLAAVFTAIEQTKALKLKNLYLANQDYSEVNIDVLAAALAKLESTDILYKISSEVTRSLFTKMSESYLIKIPNISWLKCTSVPSELFGEALVRIETVNLFYSQGLISEDQLSSLFRKIVNTEQMRLRELNLGRENISHVSPDIISHAVVKLVSFTAHDCNLTAAQLSSIFTRLSELEDHKLRTLSLVQNDLSTVPTEALVSVISGLEVVDFSQTMLTTEQLTRIYRMVADRESSRLRKINVTWNDNLGLICPDLRDRARLNQSVETEDEDNDDHFEDYLL